MDLKEVLKEQVPTGWIVSKHSRYFISRMGETILSSNLKDEGVIPVFSATESDKLFGYVNSASAILKKDDIVIPARGNSIGHVTLMNSKSTSTQTTIQTKLSSNKLLAKYVFYYLQGLRKRLFEFENTAIPQITVEQVNSNPIIIPPLQDQEDIAEFLDAETARIDALVSKKQKMIELLKIKKKNLISSCLDVRNTPLIKLKYVVNLISKKDLYENIGGNYIGLENIVSWEGKLIKSKEEVKPEGIVSTFNNGDVLFGKLRPNLAKAVLVDFKGVCSSEALVLRPSKALAEYLKYLVLEQKFIEEIVSSTYGSKMPRASWESIGSRMIKLPSLEQQKEIADYLDKETGRIDNTIAKIKLSVDKLKELRASLITEAVTGQLDIKQYKNKH